MSKSRGTNTNIKSHELRSHELTPHRKLAETNDNKHTTNNNNFILIYVRYKQLYTIHSNGNIYLYILSLWYDRSNT